jgi:hypothetical protein
MNLPESDSAGTPTNAPADRTVDGLFRQSLNALVEAAPPERVWEDIVGEIQRGPSLWQQIRRRLRLTPPYARQAPVWSALRWGKLLSWIHGSQTGYPPLPTCPYWVEPNGRWIPAPFAGVMAKQVLDVRLAS